MRTRKNIPNFVEGNSLDNVCMLASVVPRFPFRGWSEVLLVSCLSTKCNDALWKEKQMAGSRWLAVLSSNHTYVCTCKIVVFQRQENILLGTENIWCKNISIHFIETFYRLQVNSTIFLLTRSLVHARVSIDTKITFSG